MPETIDTVQEAHRRSTQTTIEDIVRFLSDTLGRALTAHIADVAPRTVTRWVDGRSSPRAEAELRLRVAYHVFLVLQKEDSPHTVRAWFIGLNPQLGDMAPAEALHQNKLKKTLAAARSFALGG